MTRPTNPTLPGPDALVIAEGPLDSIRAAYALEHKTVALSGHSSLETRMAAQEASEEFVSGEIRMDCRTARLIRLLYALYTEDELAEREEYDMPWLVEDVLTGQIYTRDDLWIGRETFNAMEVIAWASQDWHPPLEIDGD